MQLHAFGRMTGVGIGAVDLASYACAVGGTGFAVAEPAQLRPAPREALAAPVPAVVDVAMDPDVLTAADPVATVTDAVAGA